MTNFVINEMSFYETNGISRMTAYRLRKQGELPHFRLRRKILYTPEHIQLFITAHEYNVSHVSAQLPSRTDSAK